MNLATPVEMSKTIAGRVRAERCRSELTQKSLAERAGMSLGSYRRFEQTGAIDFVALLRVAQALGIDDDIESLFEKRSFSSLDEIESLSSQKEKSRVRAIKP